MDELRRMGANVQIDGNNAVFKGRSELQGAKVKGLDIRGTAALIIAGLMAEGVTEILDVQSIDRGYENIEKKLSDLGANIWRAEEL